MRTTREEGRSCEQLAADWNAFGGFWKGQPADVIGWASTAIKGNKARGEAGETRAARRAARQPNRIILARRVSAITAGADT